MVDGQVKSGGSFKRRRRLFALRTTLLTPRGAGALALLWLLALLPISSPGWVLGSDSSPIANDAACVTSGTPSMSSLEIISASTATPDSNQSPSIVGRHLGTPVAESDLLVMLFSSRELAGPNDLTVVILNEWCDPVTDATVTVRTRSLEMDHGVRTTLAEPSGEGRYMAADVPMGMAGAWEAEVTVSRSEQKEIVVAFVMTLKGTR